MTSREWSASRTSFSDQRSRISRACDRCNSLRAKCDGKNPCVRCIDSQEKCEYARRLKKRGKAAKIVSSTGNTSIISSVKAPPSDGKTGSLPDLTSSHSTASSARGILGGDMPTDEKVYSMDFDPGVSNSIQNENDSSQGRKNQSPINPAEAFNSLDFDDDGAIRYPSYVDDLQAYDQLAFDVAGAEILCGDPRNPQGLREAATEAAGQTTDRIFTSQERLSPKQTQSKAASIQDEYLKYPVLKTLMSYFNADFHLPLAEKLLESYFDSLFETSSHPLSPYIFGFVLRKKAMLHSTEPRVCSPAMLASMLWISARTSDLPELASEPTKRGQLCQHLLQLTLSHLLPVMQSPALHHASPSETGLSFNNSVNDTTIDSHSKSKLSLDDIIAYIHISTVTSASEDKRASLRWWTSAWQLARELKLGRESDHENSTQRPLSANWKMAEETRTPEFVIEEQKEERRRVYWILYILDRHLALCYNRALFLPDRESQSLLQPCGEEDWQSGAFIDTPHSSRIRGPSITCTSPSIFGFFLPLATILGELIELQFVRSNVYLSNLGSSMNNHEITFRVGVIEDHLRLYKQSLHEWFLQAGSINEAEHIDLATQQNATALAYSEHIMHVLHILVAGRWDPIELLDDADSWTSSESFRAATDHAVAGARAVCKILNVDPDLSFMPFLFGVYLLQGSFLLLFTAENFQTNVSTQLVQACETIVRAHEVCIVTLSTEYQKNFRNVMRSALAQVRGRQRRDLEGQRKKRREVLSLYRWTSDGYGLAL